MFINMWKQYDLLKQSISHYTSCRGLDLVHIVWSEPDPPSDPLVKFLNQVAKSNTKNALMQAQVWRSGPSCIWRPKIA
ncbi:putative exostosin, glycosyl transferase 64 domain, nucleotide-diphospho-sugar transferase [Helianthus debilis subsp. tardiflorus]